MIYTAEPHDHDITPSAATTTASAPAPTPIDRNAEPRCAGQGGANLHLFFSDDDLDIARAKSMCDKCAIRERCLESALARSEAYGVWGGELLIDGVPTRFPKRRGRPPRRRVEYVLGQGFRELHVA